jgi:hypothetical protein
MAGEKLSVDELLANQEKQGAFRATIEAIPDDTERVKVTPFISGLGCLCDQALNIKKDQIESISTTDDVHICCGKRLLVVEVSFKDTTVADLFQQVSNPARLGAMPGSRVPASGNQLPFMPPNLMDPSLRGSEALLRDPMPVSNFASGRYDPAQVLSTERALGGMSSMDRALSTWNPITIVRCLLQREACERGCKAYVGGRLVSADFARCMCYCENDAARCLGNQPQMDCGSMFPVT